MLLILGANGGIGRAVLQHAASDPGRAARWRGVQGCYRDMCELEDEESVKAYFSHIPGIDASPTTPAVPVQRYGSLHQRSRTQILQCRPAEDGGFQPGR